MIYGYIRVSTDKQSVENQRFEIAKFCKTQNFFVGKWVEETISGTAETKKRKLGKILNTLKEGDILICSELSRLGRNLYMIMEILKFCAENGINVWTTKDNFRFGNNIQSKVLAFALGIAAEIERNLISQRTKEALAKRKADGIKLGRPKGEIKYNTKSAKSKEKIDELFNKNASIGEIARKTGLHRNTVSRYLRGNVK